jgi:hypothetical protein
LQATLTRRLDQHFSIQASFVWSKVTGFGPLTNAYNLNSSRGVMDIDVPINFIASYIIVSPNVRHFGFLGSALSKSLANQWHHYPPFRSTIQYHFWNGHELRWGRKRPAESRRESISSLWAGARETTSTFFYTSAFAH